MRNRVWEDAVESRNPVGGNQEKILSQIEDLANLAAAKFWDSRKITCEQVHDAPNL